MKMAKYAWSVGDCYLNRFNWKLFYCEKLETIKFIINFMMSFSTKCMTFAHIWMTNITLDNLKWFCPLLLNESVERNFCTILRLNVSRTTIKWCKKTRTERLWQPFISPLNFQANLIKILPPANKFKWNTKSKLLTIKQANCCYLCNYSKFTIIIMIGWKENKNYCK